MSRGRGRRAAAALGLALLGAGAGAGCGDPAPRALMLGQEECAHCHMSLAEARFTAALVTTTGRTVPFDDPGCLARYVASGTLDPARIHSTWVADFLTPDGLLPTGRALFLATDQVRTPMHYGVIAVRPGPAADSLATALGAERLTWDGVLARVRTGDGP